MPMRIQHFFMLSKDIDNRYHAEYTWSYFEVWYTFLQLLNTFPVLFGLKNVLSFFFIFQGLNEIKIENNT